ncbi:S-methyl-5-thioribose-1-phosphate isomerase [Streptomyces sp. SID3343]|uniref:S-methyl-5-thioribose-1-phosphate isomerase n=1 Tax=Streptomyces sp. SID3343 TaxID=2690260 RepID=UPI00136F9184|nr:S-methyl-5-thioribose-1-phosphate isomerase [Streptomyces sp. SID3343]MYV98996.1 S-methyl-5-thioribose-1-phosphate isomerase [Streptomyces sp. SID3343]
MTSPISPATPASPVRSLEWLDTGLRLLDQTALPQRVVYLDITDVDALIDAIRRLAVRGAPALGAAGAYGVAVAMRQGERQGWDAGRLDAEITRVRDARPTAVNLAGGVDRVAPLIPAGLDAVLAEAHAVVREDIEANHAIGRNGADWILSRVERRPLRVLTHCNTGSLATAGWGTALGIIRELHARGLVEVVYVDETRPLLQGSRLTAWELDQEGIPHLVQPDSAAASTILRGLVDVAVIGADRIALNGDTANKIGSVGVALACADAGIPFVVAAPRTTFDDHTPTGATITIEERPESEVLEWAGTRVAPTASRAFNPAFDVTPARLISAIVDETGVRDTF